MNDLRSVSARGVAKVILVAAAVIGGLYLLYRIRTVLATLGGVLIGVVAGIDNFPTALIIWGVWVIAYQQFENNILLPIVYRRTVALHPLVVLGAVLIGITLLGVLGALLAIPLAGAGQVVVRDWWRHRKRGKGMLAAPEPPPPAPAE